MTNPDVRNGMINQAQQDRIVRDTLIMQKVNAAHREAFKTRFPGQVEHCLRLVLERLQAGLDKRSNVDVSNPHTWILSTAEIADLAEAAERLHNIRKEI